MKNIFETEIDTTPDVLGDWLAKEGKRPSSRPIRLFQSEEGEVYTNLLYGTLSNFGNHKVFGFVATITKFFVDEKGVTNYIYGFSKPGFDIKHFDDLLPTSYPIDYVINIELWPKSEDRTWVVGKCSRLEWEDYLNHIGEEIIMAFGGKAISLPPVEDPTDHRILKLVEKDPDLTDDQIGALIGMTRQNVNNRRRGLEKAGYKVR